MSSFVFDIPSDITSFTSTEQERQQQALLQKVRNLQESARLEREEEARIAALPKSRVITIRMPTSLVKQLDMVADSAATNRGHLLRQITADYLNHLRANGIVFRGTLLSFRDERSLKM